MRVLPVSDFNIPRLGRIISICLLTMLLSACITEHHNIVGEPLFLKTPEAENSNPAAASKAVDRTPESSLPAADFVEKSPHTNLHSYAHSVAPPKPPLLQDQLPFSEEQQVSLAVDNLPLKDFINHLVSFF